MTHHQLELERILVGRRDSMEGTVKGDIVGRMELPTEGGDDVRGIPASAQLLENVANLVVGERTKNGEEFRRVSLGLCCCFIQKFHSLRDRIENGLGDGDVLASQTAALAVATWM